MEQFEKKVFVSIMESFPYMKYSSGNILFERVRG